MAAMTDPASPIVSVCIPTYKRLILLRRAVASVIAQTCKDWELLISDDEDPPGETWGYLQELARGDPRVRVMRNLGAHGEGANMNNLLLQARGPWVKPLYDDDALRPECLETLLAAVRGLPSVVLVSCLFDVYLDGKRIGSLPRRGRWPLQLIPQRYAHLGMYLQDCRVPAPTSLLVSRRAIEAGALYRQEPGLVYFTDAWWCCSVLRHGDLLLVEKVLAEFHQGAHESLTQRADEWADAECPLMLQEELRCIAPDLKPPSLPVVIQMVKCLRALHYMKVGKFAESLRNVRQVWRPYAWFLLARWALSRIFPGSFHVAPRIPVTGNGQTA
jgi:glycosyltransferase involved in cell wall biosynthesis